MKEPNQAGTDFQTQLPLRQVKEPQPPKADRTHSFTEGTPFPDLAHFRPQSLDPAPCDDQDMLDGTNMKACHLPTRPWTPGSSPPGSPSYQVGRYAPAEAVLDVSCGLNSSEDPLLAPKEEEVLSLRPLRKLVYPIAQPPQPLVIRCPPSRLVKHPLTPILASRSIWHEGVWQTPEYQRWITRHLYVLNPLQYIFQRASG